MIKKIKNMNKKEMQKLSQNLRDELISTISQNGGHLASNLGVVELTIALHKVFDTPKDKIIWDVGHQSYVHKILTGRNIKNMGALEGVSRFPKTDESVYDSFNTGHSSTSISAGIGIKKALELNGDFQTKVICVIGDASISSGMAFEAINHAGYENSNIIVILNDNEMSISKNVGALSKYLNHIRVQSSYQNFKKRANSFLHKIPKIGAPTAMFLQRLKASIRSIIFPTTFFEDMGYKYIGPIDGHNLENLEYTLEHTKNIAGPILVHVLTKKGKGHEPAEKNPENFHGVTMLPQVKEVGALPSDRSGGGSSAFGEELCEIAKQNSKIIAITAAMTSGTGLCEFKEKYPNRFFDVGIAEQHAVTFAGGLACQGMIPVVSIYSSFLQRSYDQILHDVALQNLPVVFAIDRAGIVGPDGETHHGLFDLAYMLTIPNMQVFAPSSIKQLKQILNYACDKPKGPMSIRYPKQLPLESTDFIPNKSNIVQKGNDITLICVGTMLETGVKTAEVLKEYSCQIIDLVCISPLNEALLQKSIQKTKKVFILEDGIAQNGVGEKIKNLLNCDAYVFGFDKDNLPIHGSTSELFKKYELDANAISEKIRTLTKWKKCG